MSLCNRFGAIVGRMGTKERENGEAFARYVGQQIRGEAAMRGVSVAALARQIETDRVVLTRYVNGDRPMPIPILYAASAALGIDPADVLVRAQERMESE